MAVYDVGDVSEFTNTFTDNDTGNPVDPSVIHVKVRDPRNEISTYIFGTDPEVVKDSTGVYRINVYLDKPGRWTVRFEGPHNATEGAAEERAIFVGKSAFYNSLGVETPDS